MPMKKSDVADHNDMAFKTKTPEAGLGGLF